MAEDESRIIDKSGYFSQYNSSEEQPITSGLLTDPGHLRSAMRSAIESVRGYRGTYISPDEERIYLIDGVTGLIFEGEFLRNEKVYQSLRQALGIWRRLKIEQRGEESYLPGLREPQNPNDETDQLLAMAHELQAEKVTLMKGSFLLDPDLTVLAEEIVTGLEDRRSNNVVDLSDFRRRKRLKRDNPFDLV